MAPLTAQSLRHGPLALLAIVAVGLLAPAGCGGEQDPVDEDRDEIATVLDELRQAQDAGDAETACGEVYVIAEPRPGSSGSEAEAEAESGGEGGEAGLAQCEAAFRAASERTQAEVHDLSTDVGSIEVDGDTATAIVHTELQRADGSQLRQDVPYDLLRTPDGWRVRISEEG